MDDAPAIVFELLQRFAADADSGTSRTLDEYRAMFPRHAALVDREFARFFAEAPGLPLALDGPGLPGFIGSRIGPYLVTRELGRGGQGAVFLATDERIPRSVALKLLLGRGNGLLFAPGARERFRREAAVVARLDHPGIAVVYETGESDGIPYVAMRYVEGDTLAHRIAANRAAPPPDRREVLARLALVEDVARALHAAHEAGVIHRDVKPGNIMVTADGRAVVLDFGIARDLEDTAPTLTASGEIHGTPAYLSPEQLRSDRVRIDRRTDVFSLGVTLYEWIASRRPFEAATREGLYRAILESEPPRLRSLAPAAPKDLEIVVATALEKYRDRRYSTAEAFADDLRAIRESRPIAARRPSVFVRLSRFVAREPVKAALGAGLVVMVLAAAGLLGYVLARGRELDEGKKALRREEIDRAVLAGFSGYQQPPRATTLEALLEDDPNLDVARITLAISRLEHRQFEQALALCDRGSDDDARAAVNRIRAAVLHRLDRSDEAARVEAALCGPALAKGPYENFVLGILSEADSHARAEPSKEAVRYYTRAVLLSPAAELTFHFKRTLALLDTGDNENAIESARVLERRWPKSAIAWFAIGTVRGKAVGPVEGRDAFERAVALEPDSPEAYLSIGITGLILQDAAAADAAYERALQCRLDRRDPGKIQSLWGNSLYRAQRYEAAVPVLEAALAANPALVQEAKLLASSLRKANRAADAIPVARKLLERLPEDSDASKLLRKSLEDTGDVEGAIAECERRISIAKDDAEAKADLARLKP